MKHHGTRIVTWVILFLAAGTALITYSIGRAFPVLEQQWVDLWWGAACIWMLISLFRAGWTVCREIISADRRRPLLEEEIRLMDCINRLHDKGALLPRLRLWISDSCVPQAYATCWKDVVVSRGMLELLDDEELTGVLAHEIGHVSSRDPICSLLVVSVVPPYLVKRALKKVNIRTGIFIAVPLAVIAITGGHLFSPLWLAGACVGWWLLEWLFMRVILVEYRLLEYKQDAYAQRMGYGSGLRSAIIKMMPPDRRSVHLGRTVLYGDHPVWSNRVRKVEQADGLRDLHYNIHRQN